jgi:aminoglycoside/choline kinase family phosphotransferase
VLERDVRHGFLLLTDLGTRMYLPELQRKGRQTRSSTRPTR